MKTKLTVLVLTTMAICFGCGFGGCATVRSQVPVTEISGSVNGQPWKFICPKDVTLTNLSVTVSTNGSATVHVGYLQSIMDPNIITMTGQAYATMRNADSQLLDNAISTAAAAAGTTAGAAVK